MYTHKSLKLAILALFITTLVIFSGCGGGNPVTPPIDPIPEETYEDICAITDEAIDKVIDLSKQYNMEQACQMVVDYLLQEEKVIDAGVGEDRESVWYEWENGFIVSFSEYPEEDEELIPSQSVSLNKLQRQSPLFKVAPDNKKAIILDWGTALISTYYSQQIKFKLVEAGYNVEFCTKEGFTLEKVETLNDYGVIYISSHGFADDKHGIKILTGQESTPELINYYYNKYGWDNHNIIGEHVFWKEKNGEREIDEKYLCFYPGLIRKIGETKPFPNSLVYADICYGLADNSMGDAFNEYGAYVYCSYTNKTLSGCMTDLNVFKNLVDDGMNIHQAINYSGGYGYCSGLDFYPEDGGDLCLIEVEQYADISGDWSGEYCTNLISGEITYVSVTQDGADFNGEYYESNDGEGYFTGEFITQNQFIFTMTQTNTYCQGAFNGNGIIEGNQITITFSGHNCMGDHSNGTGTLYWVSKIVPCFHY